MTRHAELKERLEKPDPAFLERRQQRFAADFARALHEGGPIAAVAEVIAYSKRRERLLALRTALAGASDDQS